MKKKNMILVIFIVCSMLFINVNVYSHSGRTDSSGGHKDKNNVSGLGSYHYHCGGNPAHLHTNGVCPYSSKSQPSKSPSNQNSISTLNQLKMIQPMYQI